MGLAEGKKRKAVKDVGRALYVNGETQHASRMLVITAVADILNFRGEKHEVSSPGGLLTGDVFDSAESIKTQVETK